MRDRTGLFFNLKFMDGNDVMKEDLVEIKTSRKIKIKFYSM